MQSYQHSRPAVLNVSDDEPLLHEGLHHHRSLPWKTAVLLACIFVGMVAVLNSNSSSTSSSYLTANMSEGPPKPETFDYEKIKEQGGEYDWKKCQGSSDPDCWKKEGERVGGFWSNFGSKMRSYWSDFGQRTRDYWANLFAHKEKVADADTSTKPLDDSAAAAAPGPAPPTETEAPASPTSDSTPPEKPHKHHSSEAAP